MVHKPAAGCQPDRDRLAVVRHRGEGRGPSLLALTDNIDVGIGQQEPVPVAGLALGHHRVAGLHVAQDQGSMLDPVLLVLG